MVDIEDSSFAEVRQSGKKRVTTSRRNVLKTTGVGVLGATGLGATGGTMSVAASSDHEIEITERPDPGDESIEVEVDVPSDEDPVDVRVFHWLGDDLTDEVITVESGETDTETVELIQPLERGDSLDIAILEEGATDRDEALSMAGITVDATYIDFYASPSTSDTDVEFFASSSEDHVDEHEGGIEARVVNEADEELSDGPVDISLFFSGGIDLTDPLAEEDEISVILQPESDTYDPDEVIASASTTATADLGIAVTERPDIEDEEVEVEVFVPSDENSVDVRAFHWDEGDITDDVITVESGESVTETVELTEPLKKGDRLDIVLLEQGVTDPGEVLRETNTVVDATHIEFHASPSAGDDVIEIFAVVSEEHWDEHQGDIEARVVDGTDEELTDAAVEIFRADGRPIDLTESLTEGEEISVILQPEGDKYDPDEELTSASATASVDLSIEAPQRPDAEDEDVEVEVTVPSDHDPVDVRAFHWDKGNITDEVITVESGESATKTVELTEPLKKGDNLEIVLLEEGVSDHDEALRWAGTVVDDTYVEITQQLTDGDEDVEVFATVSDDDLDTYEEGLELRIVDADGVNLSDEPVDIELFWGGSVSVTEELVGGDEITAVVQEAADGYDEEKVQASATTTVVGDIGFTVPERPNIGAKSVEVDVDVPATRGDGVDVRAFGLDGSDLTADVLTVTPGEDIQDEVTLTDELEEGDILEVALFEEGDEDHNDAFQTVVAAVDATYAMFTQQPSDGNEFASIHITVSDEDFDDHDEVEVRIVDELDDELIEEPLPLPPEEPFGYGTIELTSELTEDEEITLAVQPQAEEYTPGETLASDPVTVSEDVGPTVSFTFSPESPDVETEVTFDASDSEPTEEIEDYLWDFTDDNDFDTTGIEATHTFTDPGDHEVTLYILDDTGEPLGITTETVNVREGCFIATAACGTPDHDQVETLRAFRDTTLKGNAIGELFVRLYYATSPPIADWIAQGPRRRSIVRSTVVRPAARIASMFGFDGSDA
ncbi:PKD domain-containing protein [Natronolimnobius sp. AArcel1]|uniref:CFI-box-CTERM domain-containing protein n=1 Tax=Natronolimnobius sp. AArcel1 TaxID=1679093 RepID=UPI0013E9F007|nr:CFI-box-CTERM domain-containing protein [Natronolimnobius sp. AArcel1]NGM71372.1 PKD domain-containing protein [Natronolimnobius sp. AArcel1]